METLTPHREQRNLLAVLLFTVFATVLGVGMAVPLLPVHARGLGATGVQIGLLTGAFALSRLVFTPWFARRSDRTGRKTWVVSGLAAYACISAALGLVDDLAWLFVLRSLHGMTSALLMPLVQACAADAAPRGSEGRVMGWFGAAALAGLGTGPILGGLAHDVVGVRGAFIIMGALAGTGAILCQARLPRAAHGPAGSPRATPAPWRSLLGDRNMTALFAFRFAYVFCIGIIWSFLPLLAGSVHAVSGAMTGVILGVGVLASGILNVPMGALADRIDGRRMVVAGGMVASCGMVALGHAGVPASFALASAIFGAGGGIAMPAVMALAARHGGRTASMGSVMALMTMSHSAGMMTGSVVGGFVVDVADLRAVFPAGAVVMLAGAAAFAWLSVPARARRRLPDSTIATVPLR